MAGYIRWMRDRSGGVFPMAVARLAYLRDRRLTTRFAARSAVPHEPRRRGGRRRLPQIIAVSVQT